MPSECRSRNGNLETMLDNCWPTVRNMGTTPIQHGATIDAYSPGESYVHVSSARTKAEALKPKAGLMLGM